MRQVHHHEIIACQSQNAGVVGDVFQRLHLSLLSLSYRYLGNTDDAQDVVMVKKICVNECYGILRARHNFHMQSLQDLSEGLNDAILLIGCAGSVVFSDYGGKQVSTKFSSLNREIEFNLKTLGDSEIEIQRAVK